MCGGSECALEAPGSKMRSDLKSLHYLSINFFAIRFNRKQRGCSDLSRAVRDLAEHDCSLVSVPLTNGRTPNNRQATNNPLNMQPFFCF